MRRKPARSNIDLATEIGMTAAGLTMAATPLALWMSPNKTAFYATLLICAVAYGVIILLSRYGSPEQPKPNSGSRQ